VRQAGSLFLAAVLPALLAAACAGGVDPARVDLSQDPAEAVARLKSGVERARAEDVHVLSPGWYRQAEDSAAEAAALLKSHAALQDILAAAARGEARLEQARRFAALARRELAAVFGARAAALKAGAPRLYPGEVESLEERFLALTSAVEDDDLAGAKADAPAVERGYRQVELKAIKEHLLGEARRLIRAADAAGARKLAPRSLARARHALAATDAFITRNPYSEETRTRAEDVLRKARHVGVVLQQVKAWRRQPVEDRILWVERQLLRVETQVIGPEAEKRVQSLDRRFAALAERARAMRHAQDFVNTELANLQGELKRLGEVQARQEAKAAREARISRVLTMFEPGEAEVFRQGDALLIRLRGLNFEVGRAYVLPAHYPLLTKLQNAIRLVGARRVLIEGHTDITGSLAHNRVLSQRRAEAVAAYLVNTGAVKREGVTAIGYGPEKPIAPNNTAAGRRLNRRIDVTLVLR